MKHQEHTTYTYDTGTDGSGYTREITEVGVEGQLVRSVVTETWTDPEGRTERVERLVYDKED